MSWSILLLVRRHSVRFTAIRWANALVKSPKVYVRDSGLVHALLGIAKPRTTLAGTPGRRTELGRASSSKDLLAAAPERTMASFYRTAAGAEIDLALELPGQHGLLGDRNQNMASPPAPEKDSTSHAAISNRSVVSSFIQAPSAIPSIRGWKPSACGHWRRRSRPYGLQEGFPDLSPRAAKGPRAGAG